MGLRGLGGCLSSNTSSSNSTASDRRPRLLRPLACVSCSSSSGAGPLESPALLRKRLVGGCLPCAPSAPLRALHSCVTGCDPKASQTASSSCSYCSSDPIVVTFNPRRSTPPGRGPAAHPQAGAFPQSDDDDYSVRTIWPEELARKMSHAHGAGGGPGAGKPSCLSRGGQNGEAPGGGMALLDCQNLREFSHTPLTDHAGRRRLWQGKMAALDFMGVSSGAEDGRSSLKRLLNHEGGAGGAGDGGEYDDMPYRPHSPSPPQSPVSFSPPHSNPGTLILKPRPRQREREREGGRSLPSAQSLHLVLDSLNRDQDEENRRLHLSLPLSSSLPASLSNEGAVTPDAENAVISAILPFLFLGNERDAEDLDLLLRLNVGFVVNVTTHLPLYHLTTGLVRYKRLPATDNSKQNLQQYFEEVFEFIEEAHQTGKGVLVHCQAGVSRSATVVIAYLMKHTLMTMTDAYKYVRGRRPVVSPNLNFMGQLLEFERDLNSGVTPRILTPKLSGLETQV
ncbi:dual specificity protein phosphatase 10 [Gadus morhua]|nr:dual specificity protein phosphatase 10-like [Gadus morhua]